MSTIPNTEQAGLAGRLRLPRRLVVLALIVALAAAALTLTIVLIASGGSGSAAPQRAVPATPSTSPSAPANDGSQHSGARP